MMNLAEYRRTASRLADYLPWAALVGEGVVLNKDGSVQRTAKFRGPDLDSAVAAELVAVAGRLNNAFRRLGTGWAIFVEAQRSEAAIYPDSTFPDPASALVDAERKAEFEQEGSHFVSAYFLTFLWLPPAEDAARSESWLYEGRETTGVNPWEQVRGFADRTDRMLALLDGFMPECAWLDDAGTLTYLHSTISTNRQRVRVPEVPVYLDALLADQPLTGGLEPRLALAAPLALAPILTTPAHAFFGGFGRIVYDPTNHAENLLTAARTLEQINNQIASLQNEAQMLINQARNLESLPHSSLQQLQQNVSRTRQLLDEAQNIAFDVQDIDRMFQQDYGNLSPTASDAQIIADARTRWQNSVGGLQDAMRVQAGVTGNIDSNREEMAALVDESQNAVGALQATQAGNQLLALQSQQISDLIAVVSANGRADALSEAERATAAEQGRIQRERFLTPGTGYQPGDARMFNN